MALTLYYHPLASFCHKVMIALYERDIAFNPRAVDLSDTASSAEVLARWPVGKIPVLHDEVRQRAVPETSIIIEYLERHHPGAAPLLPEDPEQALEARLWDRFFDNYVSAPMQKLVLDRLRPEGERDPYGIAEAARTLETAYAVADAQLRARHWAIGDTFSLADCAAAPALFFAGIAQPFAGRHASLTAYFERLLERPSFARVLREAGPYFELFPLRAQIPEALLSRLV